MTTFGRALPATMPVLLGGCALVVGIGAPPAFEPPDPVGLAAPPSLDQPDPSAPPACERRLREQVAARGWQLEWQRPADLRAPSIVDYTESIRRASGAAIVVVETPTRAHVDASFLAHREERRIARDAASADQPGCAMLDGVLQAEDRKRAGRRRYLWLAGIASLLAAVATAKGRAANRSARERASAAEASATQASATHASATEASEASPRARR